MKGALKPEAAAERIPDGSSLLIGGFMGVGTPERMIDALVARQARELTVIANDTANPGRGIGKLITAGAVRRVVTSHDAFAYFSRAYGIAFIAPIGVNTDAEPSAADVGRIIRQIRTEKIPAVFLEGISDPRLLERIQHESGARIGGTLYSDALSRAGGAAPSYLEMMRRNAATLAAALGKP